MYVSCYPASCLVVCGDDRQRPQVTLGAYALLTVSDTAMQKQKTESESEERRGKRKEEDTITGAR